MKKIAVPKVDANIEEGTLGAWLAAEGDKIRKGQVLTEYITDKAAFEIESPFTGILRKIVVPEKSVVPIGTIIGLVGRADEPLPDVEPENRRLMERHRDGMVTDAATAGQAGIDRDGKTPAPVVKTVANRPRATLAARRLARRLGIPLEKLQEKAGDQRITVAIIESFGQDSA